jgi:hypothetical protein
MSELDVRMSVDAIRERHWHLPGRGGSEDIEALLAELDRLHAALRDVYVLLPPERLDLVRPETERVLAEADSGAPGKPVMSVAMSDADEGQA